MKYIKLFLTSILILALSSACTGQDRIIKASDLPTKAQTMLNDIFKGRQATLVQRDKDGLKTFYDVVLDDGTKIEYDDKGEWCEINSKPNSVPTSLIPSQIIEYVKQNFANANIVQIERDRRGYEIDLSTGIDISFDKDMKVRKLDD